MTALGLAWLDDLMPIISIFLGIVVRVYHRDHNPPHIHVQYGEFEAILEIASGRILAGSMPPRALKILREWLKSRKSEIMRAWKDAEAQRIPRKVPPLE